MFDLGWAELLVVGVVALIVVGPKDLPVLFRNVGRFVGKARGMAREFSRAMNDAADEAGVKDMAQGFKTASNPMGAVSDTMRKAAEDLRSSVDPTKFGSPAAPDTKTSGSSDAGGLSEQRADEAKRIQAATARAAAERKAREAQEAMARADAAEAAVGTPPKDEA